MAAKTVFDQAVGAWNGKNEARFVEQFATDAELIAPGGLNFSGVEGARKWYRLWAEACPDASVLYTNVVSESERLLGEGVFNGTHTGVLHLPTGDVPATGRHLTATFAAAVTTSAEKIKTFRHYFDVMDLMAQLGLIGVEATA